MILLNPFRYLCQSLTLNFIHVALPLGVFDAIEGGVFGKMLEGGFVGI